MQNLEQINVGEAAMSEMFDKDLAIGCRFGRSGIRRECLGRRRPPPDARSGHWKPLGSDDHGMVVAALVDDPVERAASPDSRELAAAGACDVRNASPSTRAAVSHETATRVYRIAA